MPVSKLPSEPTQLGDGKVAYKIATVTDLDKLSKGTDEDGDVIWKGRIMHGTLTYDCAKKTASVVMESEDKATNIESSYSRGMRGMELSELIIFDGRLLTVCDRTGIIYDVTDGNAVPWAILADGEGNRPKGFKAEWMACKDGVLHVGGFGREFFMDGQVQDRNYMWIKKVCPSGAVEHVSWVDNYSAMRTALGFSIPGYVSHESGVWSNVHRNWFFLPRKASAEEFDDKKDETRCANVLLRCSEDFKDIKVTKVGKLTPSRGYSSFKFIPGTNDTVIVALKSEEIGSSQKSFITVFTIDGEVLLDDQHLADAKYEGVEFI